MRSKIPRLLTALALVIAVPFSNSILAGDVLVRTAIQSEGFVAGSSGWRIERNGDAEFSNLIARGKFKTSESGRRVEIIDDPEPIIWLFSGHADEVYPAYWEAEETGSSIQTRFGGGSLDGDTTPLLQFSSTVSGSTASLYGSSLDLSADSTILFNITDADDWIGVINSTGGSTKDAILVRHTGITAETWTNATLAGTWTNLGGTWPSTRYRKDPDGYVHIQIAATGGAAPPSTIFTLPVGYRPSSFAALIGEGNLAHARATVIPSTGVVQYNVGSTSNVLINTRFPSSEVN